MISLHDTLDLVHDMHYGQNDWAGLPYVTHPVWVMMHLPLVCSEEDRHLALMHDMVEDCKKQMCERYDLVGVFDNDEMVNIDILFTVLTGMGYSDYVVQGLRLLTRDLWRHMTYVEYVQNVADSGHLGAMLVKYTDNMHNTDPLRCSLLSLERRELAEQMSKRYERSKTILRAAIRSALIGKCDLDWL